jgi:SAM-dependent methyltransferase
MTAKFVPGPIENLPANPELMHGRLGLTPDNGYYDLPDLKDKRVLEIGCNDGYLARHIVRNLQPAKYLGIDPWIGKDQTEELRPRFKVGDVEERSTLPFDQVWDVVICFDVFYHLLSPLKAALHLTELAKECLVIGSAILPEGIAQSPNFAIELHHATGPVFRFEPGYNGDHSNYLFPTERCLVRVFEWAGFGRIEKKYYYEESKNGYMCDRVCLHCWK